tara:strand:+ start:77 stop:886 length:810 start_codon:yes stop_codon:yes gene_type:complete
MNQTTKRPPGRPKKTEDAPVMERQTKKKPIRRQEKVSAAQEYKANGSGAVMMLMQSGITVYDEETGMVREIRYCENENSIWKDEQADRSVKTPVIFRMGRLFVNERQPNLRNFLEIHPQNKSNGGSLFELVDNLKKVEVDIDKEFLVNDAVSLLRSKELDELLAVALAFGMDIDRPIAEVKHDLLLKAKASPKVFIESFDNPVVAMKSKIKQAVSYQIIKADNDAIKWFDTNKHIISVPVGQDPVDVFVRYCMTEAAASVVGEIERQLG